MGNIICNAMIQVVNKKFPLFWQLPVYVVWGPVGAVLFFVAILPESPWYLARRGNKEAAFKALRRLYGNVPGFDVEEEYGIIESTLAHERQLNKNDAKWRDIVTGLNWVSHSEGLASDDMQRRTSIVVVYATSAALAGQSLIGTYATCECKLSVELQCSSCLDFYSIAGVQDPFMASLIQS